jgi:hypothetical protein
MDIEVVVVAVEVDLLRVETLVRVEEVETVMSQFFAINNLKGETHEMGND